MTPILFTGGTIRTMDAARPTAPDLLVDGELIAERCAETPERFDLRGGCVLPGFTDSHTHFPTWSMAQRQVRLEGTPTIEAALDRIAEAARRLPSPDAWLRGLGWRVDEWDPPTAP